MEEPLAYAHIDISLILVNIGSFLALVAVLNWLFDTYTKHRLHAELLEIIMGGRNVYILFVME